MVEAIANRNPPPKLIAGFLGATNRKVPLFPEDYDWKEQERVLGAVERLYENVTEELWEELVRHTDDKRYSLTLISTSGVYAAGNETVGYFCEDLAVLVLRGVFQRHLPEKQHDLMRRKIPIPVGVEVNLREWRKKRMNKALYELQIEVCERALKELETVKGVDKDKLTAARKQIAREVEDLKRHKRPVLLQYAELGVGANNCYSAKSAEGVREDLRKAGLLHKR